MVYKPWTTDAQKEWLASRRKGFADAQAADTTSAFIAATTEAFINTWPLDDPTPEELTEAGGNLDAAIKQKRLKMKDRVGWWFRNCARANANGGKGKAGLIPINPPRARALMPYQAYMRLYSDRIMPVIHRQYDNYKSITLEEGRKGLWAFTIEEARRMLAEEPDDVKAKVEEYRKQTVEEAGPIVIEPQALMDKGLVEAQKILCDVQKNINRLSRTGEDTLKKVEELTGFKGVLLVGGPHPETGRLVTLAIQNGRTLTLGNVFSHACENWGVVQTSFEQFIASCFPAELPGQLEALYRGQPPIFGGTDAKATGGGDNAQTSKLVLNASDSSLTTTNPSAELANYPPASAAAPLLAPAVSPSTPATTATNRRPREKTYDELRTEQIARNKVRLTRIMAGLPANSDDGQSDEEAAGMDTADDDDDDYVVVEAPEWAKKGRAQLAEVSTSDFWVQLVKAWWTLEQSLGFESGKLLMKNRPEEISVWIKYGRKTSPTIKSLTNYAGAWRKWWAMLQPECRRSGDSGWPLLKVSSDSDAAWDNLRRGGSNGIFVVAMSLAWWVQRVEESGEAANEVVEAVQDATWAFTTMAMLTPAVDDPDVEKSERASKRRKSA